MIDHIEENNLQDRVDVKATFCFEQCDRGPSVTIGKKTFEGCTFKKACDEMHEILKSK
jgi:NADH-quinone oxidoreductase subunit G